MSATAKYPREDVLGTEGAVGLSAVHRAPQILRFEQTSDTFKVRWNRLLRGWWKHFLQPMSRYRQSGLVCAKHKNSHAVTSLSGGTQTRCTLRNPISLPDQS